MSSMVSPQVLIVGSGPAGLVLALALVKNGISVRIIEKSTEHHAAERGAGVVPRTLETEYFLGVCADIQRVGLGPPTMNFFDLADPYRIKKSFEMVQKVDATPAYPITEPVMIGQWLHQKILRQHLEELGCHVELGCMLQTIEQRDESVIAHLVKTVDGKQLEETVQFAYVVGADGAHSTVRKALDVNFVGESRDLRVYLIDARMEGMPAEGKDFYRWGDDVHYAASLKYTVLPGVFQMLLAGEQVDFDALKTGSVEAIQSTFSTLSGRKDLKVTEILTHGEWRPNIRIAEHFGDGRVFIVGDAAHVHPPSGGQGLNSGIQDSFNLAWKLALSLKSRASPTLLNSYESERLPVIAEMLHITTGLFNKLASRRETQRGIEAAQAQAQAQKEEDRDKAYSRDWKLFQLDLNYRWSEIVFDERFTKDESSANIERNAYGVAGHDIRAGDRAPDAPGLTDVAEHSSGSSATRLFDVFKPTVHTVLVFTAEPSAGSIANVLAPFSRIPKELVQIAFILPSGVSSPRVDHPSLNIKHTFCDAQGHAYKGYGLQPGEKETTVVIIRPDGVVGAFARTSEGIKKYLSLVFA
ncbi:hypothetical protein ACEPAF_6095 [Sanghuangporus sanghuang]